jgi:hypothetical protein
MKTADPEIYTSEEKMDEYCARVSEQLLRPASGAPDIFASDDTFEAYCTRIAAQLESQWDERAGFLRRSKDRLLALQRAARAVGDTQVEEEISVQLAAAAAALHRLEEVAPDLSPDRSKAAA